MGRPRGFDEAEVVRAAAALFAGRTYDGVSVDDLVTHLGVHRNSLYKTFGSKRGLYLAALRWYLEHEVHPLVASLGRAGDPVRAARLASEAGAGLDFLLLATVERAPVDAEVAAEVTSALHAVDGALGAVLHAGPDNGRRADDGGASSALATAFTAALLGLRLRAKAGGPDTGPDRAGAALAQRLDSTLSR
ncbi:TetR/AcrR family transcriptional repressor of nem operon [Saccharothrix tamanrassetensis]|uniref:TetR/AcrR family transcriptional repressor of nem operon n=1 Tax=Saccharothrix tamanrassetensis TaxID=1051531 RepID=A0A841CMN3_9PSEU|nr:TetR/AcrR family transcriptional regulator [Saccharothrix tamanrassetensis]MBB5956816.1 TetR/AcrR family transcriptional repressor of nem operon [Saccharothrix tamanrassetensis]